MKLTATIKLKPTAEHAIALKQTLETTNAACNWISGRAWDTKTFGQYALHKLVYHECKKRFGLTAQIVVRCIAKVADAYKLDKKTRRHFRKHAAQPYDNRILRFATDDTVSIWTVDGRIKIQWSAGEHQRKLLTFRQGESDLMFIRGKWYLACTCDIADPGSDSTVDVLGIDLGIVNIATDSEGTVYSGAEIERKRRIFAHRRRNLQRNGSRSAKRKLKKIAGQQARYQKDVNHCISKAIVQTAQRTARAIGLEDLIGIRKRVKARRRQRNRLSNWGFNQLRSYIEYKAKLAGIPVIGVDPRYTSQECRRCFHVSRQNRLSQDTFRCVQCGFSAHADTNAACNIQVRALVNEPMVAARQLQLAFV